jgi:hypothetical protein
MSFLNFFSQKLQNLSYSAQNLTGADFSDPQFQLQKKTLGLTHCTKGLCCELT